MQFKTRKLYRYRGAIGVIALVLIIYGSAFSAVALVGRFRPSNLAEMLPDNWLIALTLLVMSELVFLLMIGLVDWLIWLILMKPLFTRGELSVAFGFEFGRQGPIKRILKPVFHLVY